MNAFVRWAHCAALPRDIRRRSPQHTSVLEAVLQLRIPSCCDALIKCDERLIAILGFFFFSVLFQKVHVKRFLVYSIQRGASNNSEMHSGFKSLRNALFMLLSLINSGLTLSKMLSPHNGNLSLYPSAHSTQRDLVHILHTRMLDSLHPSCCFARQQ